MALITGGASGIGAAHVKLFAAEGAYMVFGDIQEDIAHGSHYLCSDDVCYVTGIELPIDGS